MKIPFSQFNDCSFYLTFFGVCLIHNYEQNLEGGERTQVASFFSWLQLLLVVFVGKNVINGIVSTVL